jgi:hypothetical protein
MNITRTLRTAIPLGILTAIAAPQAHATSHAVNPAWAFVGEPPDIVVPAGRHSEVRAPFLMTKTPLGSRQQLNSSYGIGYSVSAPGIWVSRTEQGNAEADSSRPLAGSCNDEMPGDFPAAGFIPFVIDVSPAVPPGIHSLDLSYILGEGDTDSTYIQTGTLHNGAVTIFVVNADQPGADDIQFNLPVSAATTEVSIQHPLLSFGGSIQVSEVVPHGSTGVPWRLVYETATGSWFVRAATTAPLPAGTSFNVKVEGKANGTNNLNLVAHGSNIRYDGCLQVVSDVADGNPQAAFLLTGYDPLVHRTDPGKCSSGLCVPVATYDTSDNRWKVCHSDGTSYRDGEGVMIKVIGSLGGSDSAISATLQNVGTQRGNGELAGLCDALSIPNWYGANWGALWPSACESVGATPWSASDLILTSLSEPVGVRENMPVGPYLVYGPAPLNPGWATMWGTAGGSGTPAPSPVAVRLNPQPLKRTPSYSNTWALGAYSNLSQSLTTPYGSAQDLGIWDFATLSPFRDAAGINPNGLVAGSPTPIIGPNGYGAHFNGSTDAIYVSGMAPIDGDITACLWYRANAADVPSSGVPPKLLSFQADQRHPSWQIQMNPGGKIGLAANEGPSQTIMDGISTADGAWHGIQFKRIVSPGTNDAYFEITVDGRRPPFSTTGTAANKAPAGILLGATGVYTIPGVYANYFKGDIGYVHIFKGNANCFFPNGALGTEYFDAHSLLADWRNTTCGGICTSQTQSDRALCYTYLDCYRDHSCWPTASCDANSCHQVPACALPDGVCGVNGKPGGMAPKTIADQVFTCLEGM